MILSKKLKRGMVLLDLDLLKTIALDYENRYSKNNYSGEELHEQCYSIKKGRIPILISSPHTVFQTRKDRLKEPEDFTGALGDIVQSITDCFYICSVRDDKEDPREITETEYKKALADLVAKNNIKYFIDLHGAALKRPFDVDLGTNYGQLLEDSISKSIITIFNQNGVNEVRLNELFKADKIQTLAFYSFNKLNIPSVQIEINKRFRKPETDIESFYKLVSSIIDIVYYLNSLEIKNDLM